MIKYCWWNKSWATLLVLHLLARIYHKGCLCCWREDRCLLFTCRLSEGCTADYVQQVVDALLERGFFSKAQYEKNGILTSESIQDHYFEAIQQRKCVEVSTDYLLIEISKYKNLYVDGSNVDFLVKPNTKKMEFLLRKVYRTITLRRYNNGSV